MSETPQLPLATVQTTVGSAARWAILSALSEGTSLMVSELAQRTGLTPTAVSKQLAQLTADHVVVNPRGRLYEINPAFPIDKTAHTLDLGHCLLRFHAGKASQTQAEE